MDISYHSASLNMTLDFSKKAALVIVSNVIEREFNCVNCVKSVCVGGAEEQVKSDQIFHC